VGARELHPAIAAVEEPTQHRERRAVEPFGNIDAADMVDDDGRIDRSDEIVMLAHPLAAQMHGDMPAVRRDRLDNLTHVRVWHRRAEMGKMKMQADAADTGLVEPLDLSRRRIRFEQGNAAI